jgi:hypothetical protein
MGSDILADGSEKITTSLAPQNVLLAEKPNQKSRVFGLQSIIVSFSQN